MADKQDMQKYLQQTHDKIFESNRKWAEEQKSKNPQFFDKLCEGQSPEYLWIGTFLFPPPFSSSTTTATTIIIYTIRE